jgi:hypothetical protein
MEEEPMGAGGRTPPPPRRAALATIAPIAGLLLPLLGAAPPAVRGATLVPVAVTVTSFAQFDYPDSGQGRITGDYYARVKIGSFAAQDSPVMRYADAGEPFWTFTRSVDVSLGAVPIAIQLWDSDEPPGRDEQVDVVSAPFDQDLDLTFDLRNGTWTGDVAQNRTHSRGGGDFRPYAAITFAITTLSADGDGLLDHWEQFGLDADGDGTIDVDLLAMGADPRHKDLFLELDAAAGRPLGRGHIQAVQESFAMAPITAGIDAGSLRNGISAKRNPDGRPGINLWIDTGSLTDPTASEDGAGGDTCGDGSNNGGDAARADARDPDCLAGDNLGGGNTLGAIASCTLDSEFYAAKARNFSPGRRAVFRYAIIAEGRGCGVGGRGELGGNDFIAFGGGALLLMHEFGHNLDFHHGGDDEADCKPNYVSIMNYEHPGILRPGGSRILDFSPPRIAADGSVRGTAPLPAIAEGALHDTAVLDPTDPVNHFVFTDPNNKKVVRRLSRPANWNNDTDPPAEADLPPQNVDNTGLGSVFGGPPIPIIPECANATTDGALAGHDDWSRISLPFRQLGDPANGPITPVLTPEPTEEARRQHAARLVTGAPPTVTADDTARPAGVPNPPFTATATGLLNGDTLAGLGITCASAATPTSPVGTYPITCAGDPGGYTATFLPGTLAVGKRATTLAITSSPTLPLGAQGEITVTATLTGAGGGAARRSTGDLRGGWRERERDHRARRRGDRHPRPALGAVHPHGALRRRYRPRVLAGDAGAHRLPGDTVRHLGRQPRRRRHRRPVPDLGCAMGQAGRRRRLPRHRQLQGLRRHPGRRGPGVGGEPGRRGRPAAGGRALHRRRRHRARGQQRRDHRRDGGQGRRPAGRRAAALPAQPRA